MTDSKRLSQGSGVSPSTIRRRALSNNFINKSIPPPPDAPPVRIPEEDKEEYELQAEELSDIFTFFDTDNDGYLSVPDATHVFRTLGFNANQDILEMEYQGKPGIMRDEFLEWAFMWMKRLKASLSSEGKSEPKLRQMFALLNRTHSGNLQAIELVRFLQESGHRFEEKFVRELVYIMNKGSGEDVCFEDFARFLDEYNTLALPPDKLTRR
eukprot:gnl/Hemi2/20323_TR6743_c0_g1_i1.p1 gnl/Hemi2/20323_TR6743_c0_g1~~gnl/Hemi2/20323_TR6743_c0_g1_i1.p1  ORF type:complete len:211 (-),score=51.15 gnl/Hemi2/20323_TR6743_c0_g1_i1:76-708(-)